MYLSLAARARRRPLALATCLALLLALVALPALAVLSTGSSASADTGDYTGPVWALSDEPGPPPTGTYTKDVESGAAGTPRLTYDYDLRSGPQNRGNGVDETHWDFTAPAPDQPSGSPTDYASCEGDCYPSDVTVPYTWQGLHAWAGVTARLELIVEDAEGTVTTIETPYAPDRQSCCDSPSNGFITGGVATFPIASIPPGGRYGFRITGSNGDYNSFLRGTLTLSTQPYLEALGDDNRQWTNPELLGTEDAGVVGALASRSGTIDEPGEARWYKFRVIPGQRVRVKLTGLPADYDLAVYGDIHAAFDKLSAGSTDVTKLAAATSGTVPGNGGQVPQYADPDYPNPVTNVPDKDHPGTPGAKFAPRVYAPRVYAPRVYAPRVYAPRVYAPRVYAPRVYAPSAGSYLDDSGSQNFRDAFAGAQSQSLLAVSANAGSGAAGDESVTVSSGDTDGYFYVRVQGHDDKVSDKVNPFTVSREVVTDQGCAGVKPLDHPATDDWTAPAADNGGDPATVIVTDTSRLGLSGQDATDYLDTLHSLARGTNGVVVDLTDVPAVVTLHDKADDATTCAYASNLVAGAIKDVVDHYRQTWWGYPTDNVRYVVIAGGDDVVPFFRYPDLSGFGSEDNFELQKFLNGQPRTSLEDNQVLSQDAYGARNDLTIGGSTIPVPDLAVGRLVKTPAEITSTVEHYLSAPGGSTVIRPQKSLVTGYDFLSDAADAVQEQVEAGMDVTPVDPRECRKHTDEVDPPVGPADCLIEDYGTAHGDSWTGDDLADKVLGRHNDVMFLAGHFSANDTLAADFDTTFAANELAEKDTSGNPTDTPVTAPGSTAPLLSDSLVVSPGCHSGYGIVDGAAPTLADTADWAQRMAQHHAVLVAGTGYQYGDSDFLAYSERLYLGFFKELRADNAEAGGSPTPVATGEALVRAKQDYLATLATMTGIDQKAVLQATLYGLPMVGVDFADRIQGDPSDSVVTPDKLEYPDDPGASLGLQTSDLDFDTDIQDHKKPATADAPELAWWEGPDGVTSLPGAPVLPKQVVNVSSPSWSTLRGVGFRSGTYTEKAGLYPLTGAPAVEGTTPHTTFFSPAWFPQQMFSTNYFDALGGRGSGGCTSLVVSPTQWRSDAGSPDVPLGQATNTVRAYSHVGVRLFYSYPSLDGGDSPPAAEAPGITDVSGTSRGQTVSFSARVAGAPTAGVQQVWVTWTDGPHGGVGEWQSSDLVQDPNDTTLWSGDLTLPDGVDPSKVRFVVQAANGVGAVGLDTAEGNGYAVTDAQRDAAAMTVTATNLRPNNGGAIRANVTTPGGSPLPGRVVHFTLTKTGATTPFADQVGVTDADGNASMPSGLALPLGDANLRTELLPPTGKQPIAPIEQQVTVSDPATGALTVPNPVTATDRRFSVTVTDVDSGTPMAGRRVRWTLLVGTTPKLSPVDLATTDGDGVASWTLPTGVDLPVGPATVQAKVLDASGSTTNPSVWTGTAATTLAATLTVSPGVLSAPARTAFPTPLPVATVKDVNGRLVKGASVTFSVPSDRVLLTTPSPWGVANGVARATVVTGSSGVATGTATMPALKAGSTIGDYRLTVSVPGATDQTVTLVTQYPLSSFISPVLNGGTTSTNANGTTPMKISVLRPDGSKLDDASASQLAKDKKVQVTWKRTVGSCSPAVSTAPVYPAYDASKDFFQADLKAPAMGWKSKCSYLVTFTVDDPAGNPAFDLGNRSFTVKVG